MILPADGTDFPFFGGGEPGCFHCFDCSYVSGVKWWTHVASTVTIHLRNASESPWYRRRFLRDTSALLAFWESFKSFGTHLAETFVISKWVWIMAWTRSSDMPTSLAIWAIVDRLSLRMIDSTLYIVSGVIALTGVPGECSVSTLLRPRLNSAVQYLTVVIEIASSPYVATMSSWLFVFVISLI